MRRLPLDLEELNDQAGTHPTGALYGRLLRVAESPPGLAETS